MSLASSSSTRAAALFISTVEYLLSRRKILRLARQLQVRSMRYSPKSPRRYSYLIWDIYTSIENSPHSSLRNLPDFCLSLLLPHVSERLACASSVSFGPRMNCFPLISASLTMSFEVRSSLSSALIGEYLKLQISSIFNRCRLRCHSA